jgi:hypothetical protein
MIRRVAFPKAILAGVLGALAWEVIARVLITFHVPIIDMVQMLGTAVWSKSPSQLYYPTGLLIHAGIGAIWAIFYAYFFWSELPWKPVYQGLAFAIIPALVAGLIMIPQLGWMHPMVLAGQIPHPGVFAVSYGWGGPIGVIAGHIVYGLALGIVYVRPVGYRVKRGLANV